LQQIAAKFYDSRAPYGVCREKMLKPVFFAFFFIGMGKARQTPRVNLTGGGFLPITFFNGYKGKGNEIHMFNDLCKV